MRGAYYTFFLIGNLIREMGYFPLLCQWLSNRYNFKQYEEGRAFKIVAVILTFLDEFIHKIIEH